MVDQYSLPIILQANLWAVAKRLPDRQQNFLQKVELGGGFAGIWQVIAVDQRDNQGGMRAGNRPANEDLAVGIRQQPAPILNQIRQHHGHRAADTRLAMYQNPPPCFNLLMDKSCPLA
jgi:hypothetical protein